MTDPAAILTPAVVVARDERTVRLGDLGIARENVRFNQPPNEDSPVVAAPLKAAGQPQRLTVRPGRVRKGRPFKVLNGCRRLLAFGLLLSAHDIDEDHPVEIYTIIVLSADTWETAAGSRHFGQIRAGTPVEVLAIVRCRSLLEYILKLLRHEADVLSEKHDLRVSLGPVFLREARMSDIALVVGDLRKSDLLDRIATTPLPPHVARARSLAASRRAFAFELDNVCVALVGIKPSDDEGAGIWLIGTERFGTMLQQGGLRHCRKGLDLIRDGAPKVYNFVPRLNTTDIPWLLWLGFRPMLAISKFRGRGAPASRCNGIKGGLCQNNHPQHHRRSGSFLIAAWPVWCEDLGWAGLSSNVGQSPKAFQH